MDKLEVNKVYVGSSLDVLKTFPDESIDMCITSPPYWGLRDYGTATWEGGDENCNHMSAKEKSRYDYSLDSSPIQQPTKGTDAPRWKAKCPDCGAIKIDKQLGLEETPKEFINNLCDIFDEVKRVLKPHGSCWVNLGDSYANSGVMGKVEEQPKSTKGLAYGRAGTPKGIKTKSLIMIPSRFAIEMIDRGWILRNEIIWYKPTCMPTSATDRYTVDFEKLFFFTKESKYYFKQQLEPSVSTPHAPGNKFHEDKVSGPNNRGGKSQWDDTSRVWGSEDPNMRNKRTVWSINPASFKDAHFATYPPKLIESPIDAGCPEFVDKKTGKPRERVVEKTTLERYELPKDHPSHRPERYEGKYKQGQRYATYDDKGYEDGRYDDEFVPGIVLDPFFGSGTTAEVAMEQDKDWVGIELNPDYEKISQKRLKPTIVKKKTREKASEFWDVR